MNLRSLSYCVPALLLVAVVALAWRTAPDLAPDGRAAGSSPQTRAPRVAQGLVEDSRRIEFETVERGPIEGRVGLRQQDALSVAQRAQVSATLTRSLDLARDQHLAAMKVPAESIEAFQQQQIALLEVRRLEAAIQQLEQGRGQAFRAATGDAYAACKQLPRNWVRFEISNATTAPDGSSVDVVVAMDPETEPALVAADREIAQLGAARQQSHVAQFNSKPYSERVALLRAHRDAMTELEAGRPAGCSESEWLRRRDALLTRRLPITARIDWNSMTIEAD